MQISWIIIPLGHNIVSDQNSCLDIWNDFMLKRPAIYRKAIKVPDISNLFGDTLKRIITSQNYSSRYR